MGVCIVSLWEKRQSDKTQENKQKLQTTQMHQQSASGPNTPLAKKKAWRLHFSLNWRAVGWELPSPKCQRRTGGLESGWTERLGPSCGR